MCTGHFPLGVALEVLSVFLCSPPLNNQCKAIRTPGHFNMQMSNMQMGTRVNPPPALPLLRNQKCGKRTKRTRRKCCTLFGLKVKQSTLMAPVDSITKSMLIYWSRINALFFLALSLSLSVFFFCFVLILFIY